MERVYYYYDDDNTKTRETNPTNQPTSKPRNNDKTRTNKTRKDKTSIVDGR